MTNYVQARILDPSRYYGTPDDVLIDDHLSHIDKSKILNSLADDADQKLEATSEGMAEPSLSNNAKALQSALVQLENNKDVEAEEKTSVQTGRFERILVVTTVDQRLNREISRVAFDTAASMGSKVYLLNAVPSAFEGAALAMGGPMVAAVPLVATDDAQIIEDRRNQLVELRADFSSSVETEIEVRNGQIEEIVVEYAAECDADLIIVGSPNRSWLEAFLDTPVARRVTRSALCPVMVVPEPA